MKKYVLPLIFLMTFTIQAQEHAWVYFLDKPNEVTFIANPLTMLTQRALDRRTRQNIALTVDDVPISNAYINQVIAQTGITVKAKSKWLNAVHVLGTTTDIDNLENLSFVASVEYADRSLNAKTDLINEETDKFGTLVTYNYGGSSNQASQISVDFLHENDFTGNGMQIAILDAGFPGVDTFAAFQQIRDNNQILDTYNFVDRTTDVYQHSSHGTAVLSTIAGFDDGNLVGTALNASFYLFLTEDAPVEIPLEESLWVEAAEKADSLGVDIINSSLGYQDFDDSKYDHIYADMDGNTTFISRGANKAALTGMIVVVAAGNDGANSDYSNIASPADASHVFTIGAVDANNDIAYFSSFGPNFNGIIKPDVCAKGFQTTIINSSGNVSQGNGTSFASPVMAGAMACLWEAFPNKTNFELMQYVRESAHLYANPTDQEGYGIPNFQTAYQALNQSATVTSFDTNEIFVFPNPLLDTLTILNKNETSYTIAIFDILGKQIVINNYSGLRNDINVSQLRQGIYFLKINNETRKIIKL